MHHSTFKTFIFFIYNFKLLQKELQCEASKGEDKILTYGEQTIKELNKALPIEAFPFITKSVLKKESFGNLQKNLQFEKASTSGC